MTAASLFNPTWQYADGRVTLTNTYRGDRYTVGAPAVGRGEDFVGGPNNESPRRIDYGNWPLFQSSAAAGGPDWAALPDGGNLSLNVPCTAASTTTSSRTASRRRPTST